MQYYNLQVTVASIMIHQLAYLCQVRLKYNYYNTFSDCFKTINILVPFSCLIVINAHMVIGKQNSYGEQHQEYIKGWQHSVF